MRLGIDIGNSTVKQVVINNNGEIIDRKRDFHHGDVEGKIKKLIFEIQNKFPNEEFKFGITGDNGDKFSKLDSYLINEVPCIIRGGKEIAPHAKSIVDIGAQNSKFLTNLNPSEGRLILATNTSCSAGTGSFLEEQASRLNISLEQISDMCRKSTTTVNIAGRCSVFSKTDITHHHQEGKSVEDILMGLCSAMVRNFKGNVIKNIQLNLPVVFVGGLGENYGITESLKSILKIDGDNFIQSSESEIASALGAALLAEKKISMKNLLESVTVEREDEESRSFFQPLKEIGSGDADGKHDVIKRGLKTENSNLESGDYSSDSNGNLDESRATEGYLGIDIGSTTTKMVVTGEKGEVLAQNYLRTLGKPIVAVEKALEEIESQFPDGIIYKSIVTTGSGRYLIGNRMKADGIINEITTQAKAAIFLDRDVDTIFEIGGQDSKYIHIQDGVIDDFEMNKICSAGTGSFLEEQAIKLGTPIEEFSVIALEGENPCTLGERCTVFIEGSINKAISENRKMEDIYAGLTYAIVKNYLNGVVGSRPIGDKIFLQGGIAYNQAVVNAFRVITGKEIIVPPFFSVTGAYGASLYARELYQKKTTQNGELNEDEIFTEIVDERESAQKVFMEGYTDILDPKKKTVGVPRVLFFHKLFPIFNKFFRTLGYNVILSDETNAKTIAESREHSTIETCYPVKLANGHIAELIERGADYIFLPNIHEVSYKNTNSHTSYSCVYMQSSGKIIDSNMNLAEKGVELLNPSITFKFGKTYIAKTLLDMCKQLGISRFKGLNAIKNALFMHTRIMDALEDSGRKIISELKPNEKLFVIMARDYDVMDPVLNLGIAKKLKEMGHKVISMGNLEAFNLDLQEDYPNMYWPFGRHVLAAGKIVRDTPNLYGIYITNHGCGPDGMLNHYMKQEMKGKPYLHIEVDEHSSAVGVITRLEAFIDSIGGYNGKEQKWSYISELTKEEKKIYIPYTYPLAQLLEKQFRVEGKEVAVLPPSTEKSLDSGKKIIKGKEYYSLTNLLGDVFHNISKEDRGSIFIPQNMGGEVCGQYGEFVNRKLHENGYRASVFGPFLEDIPKYSFKESSKSIFTRKSNGNTSGGTVRNFFEITVIADIIRRGERSNQPKYIEIALEIIEKDCQEKDIITLAQMVEKDLAKRESKEGRERKKILISGENSVLNTPMLNKNRFEKLEEKYDVIYAPYSESLLYDWKDSKHSHLLKNQENLIEGVSKALGKFTPYSPSISELDRKLDKKLEHFNGGDGKYRIAKILESQDRIDGIIHTGSMYENTGVVIRHILENRSENLRKPYINLEFDYSNHDNSSLALESFLLYL